MNESNKETTQGQPPKNGRPATRSDWPWTNGGSIKVLTGSMQLLWGARPARVHWAAPSRPNGDARMAAPFGDFGRADVRREGAPNGSRGGCAPLKLQLHGFGLAGTKQKKPRMNTNGHESEAVETKCAVRTFAHCLVNVGSADLSALNSCFYSCPFVVELHVFGLGQA